MNAKCETPRPFLTISSAYREDSIVSIAGAASAASRLRAFYTTLYLARYQAVAERIPGLPASVARELGRRGFSGIEPTRIHSVASFSELLNVGARRTLGALAPAVSNALMYRSALKFDAAVSKRVARSPADVIVGMNTASLRTFQVVQGSGSLKVLNCVTNHPAEVNRLLAEFAGIKPPHHECPPAWDAAHRDREVELADLVLVPSKFVAADLLARGASGEKIAILPYGADPAAFRPCSFAERAASPSRKLECLYVGHISYRKGIPILLDAARRCRDLPILFRLIGPMISSEIMESKPDNVVYDGVTTQGGVAEVMRRADLLVFPTNADAFGRVVTEAMASALPVVTTVNNGAAEIIDDGSDGFVVPAGDPGALADAIRRLAEDPELRRQVGQAARRKIETTFSWESYGRRVLAAIDDFVNRRSTVDAPASSAV